MFEFDKCVIEKTNGEYVTWGHIVEFDSEHIKIRVKSEYSDYNLYRIILFIYNSTKGECKYHADVSEIDEKNIILKNIELLSSVQKRSNTRVGKMIKYQITDTFKDKKIITLEKPIDITILNISAVGLYFSSDENLVLGFTFQLVFNEFKNPIYLEVEIIRRDEYARSYNYGCIFKNISNKEMDEIFRFVLKEQIVQRRRHLDI
jgi:hypothetical protein